MLASCVRWAALAILLSAAPVFAQTAATPVVPAATAAVPATVEDDTYKLGTGDKIRVIVYGETDLGGEFVIDSGGFLRFPLVGQIKAADLTPRQVEGEITNALKDGYVKDPHVNVEVETYRPFYIIGEVNKPGEYPYISGLNAINAVALAGGYTYRANEDNVYVRHKGGNAEEKLPANQATPVLPGDIVRIAERFF